ncbi:uncharacterized protein BJ171DRAFT_249972 [Polychytrium aggregatum]|uniref:uncharacterized protein n=1 Tax=Polychytrium aggregatum TaxID=110093 RepID=UPI0022FDD7C3|nr:uncharacterized protein BJ171DRAFT_249972 [Polychytrium aggregatum]KAI9193646.1 hypothetical protein BJ171DRAFT_249972 [Polychytrium aggregatum]
MSFPKTTRVTSKLGDFFSKLSPSPSKDGAAGAAAATGTSTKTTSVTENGVTTTTTVTTVNGKTTTTITKTGVPTNSAPQGPSTKPLANLLSKFNKSQNGAVPAPPPKDPPFVASITPPVSPPSKPQEPAPAPVPAPTISYISVPAPLSTSNVKDVLSVVNSAAVGGDPSYSGPKLEFTEDDFIDTDNHAKKAPKHAEHSPETLARYLCDPFQSDLHKLRAIYVWITHNIAYDTQAYFAGKLHKPVVEEILRERRAVCSGYSVLFQEIGKAAGLDVRTVIGFSRGVGYLPGDMTMQRSRDGKPFGHEWNAVLIRGRWRLIDSTWGAGHLNGTNFVFSFTPYYFLTSPRKFIFTHYPGEAHQQFLTPPLSEDQFHQLPYTKACFHINRVDLIKPRGDSRALHIIEVHDDWVEIEFTMDDVPGPDILTTTFQFPCPRDARGRLQLVGPRVNCNVQERVIPGNKKHIVVKALCPKGGEGHLTVFCLTEDMVKAQKASSLMHGSAEGGPIFSFLIRNTGTGKGYVPLATIVPNPANPPFALREPLHEILKVGTTQKFVITNDGADKADYNLAVVAPGNVKTELQSRNSEMYFGEVTIDKPGQYMLGVIKRNGNAWRVEGLSVFKGE